MKALVIYDATGKIWSIFYGEDQVPQGLLALFVDIPDGGQLERIDVTPLLLVLAIALGVACYFVIPRTDLEYEYLFVNGEFDIDMVMAKSKRKKVMSVNLSEADLIAPLNSHKMDYYNGNSRMKTLDYSSGNPEHKRFAIIMKAGGENSRIIIEPDDEMAKAIKNSAPSKVFLD